MGNLRLDLHISIQSNDEETDVSVEDVNCKATDQGLKKSDAIPIVANPAQIQLVPIGWIRRAAQELDLRDARGSFPRVLPISTRGFQFRECFDSGALFCAIVHTEGCELVRWKETNDAPANEKGGAVLSVPCHFWWTRCRRTNDRESSDKHFECSRLVSNSNQVLALRKEKNRTMAGQCCIRVSYSRLLLAQSARDVGCRGQSDPSAQEESSQRNATEIRAAVFWNYIDAVCVNGLSNNPTVADRYRSSRHP